MVTLLAGPRSSCLPARLRANPDPHTALLNPLSPLLAITYRRSWQLTTTIFRFLTLCFRLLTAWPFIWVTKLVVLQFSEANLPKQVEPPYKTLEITAFPPKTAQKGQAPLQPPVNTQIPAAGTADQSLASASQNRSKRNSTTRTDTEVRRYQEPANEASNDLHRRTAPGQLSDMDGGRVASSSTFSQSHSNHSAQNQPQLVPIQRFSFFKWEINVDTLVRLFIIA